MRVYTTDRYYMRGRGGEYYHDPDAYIRGRGIASIFGRIFSSVVPLVKGVFNIGSRAAKSQVGRALTKEVKKSATQAGLNVVSDALQGRNIIESSKREIAKATQRVGRKVGKLANPDRGKSLAPPKVKTRKPRVKRSRAAYGGGKRRRGRRGSTSKRTSKRTRGGGIKKKGRKKSKSGTKRVKISTLFD